MIKDESVLTILRLLVSYRAFKSFCKERTRCKGCPYWVNKLCTVAEDETILIKAADVSLMYLVENGIPLHSERVEVEA